LGHLPFLLLPSLKTVIIYTVSRHERKVVVVGCSRRWEFKQEMVPTGDDDALVVRKYSLQGAIY